MRRVFLVNRIACDGEAGPYWEAVQQHFRDAFPDMEVMYPASADAGTQLAKEIALSGIESCVVTVGGEGTMNRALNGIIDSGRYDNVSMALVPFGNVNDYASNIGLKKNWKHALQALKSNRQERVGVVRVTTEDKVEYALNIADIGFGATTAKSHSVDHQLSWLKGQLKYNVLALKTLLRWKNVQARITIDDRVINNEIAILLAGFSPTLGGFHLVPHASPVSEKFAVSYAINPNKLQILGLIERAKKKNLVANDMIHFDNGSRLFIETQEPMVVEVDGEIVSTGSREILFEAMPRAMKFVIPPDSVLQDKGVESS
ncbi:MAG: diacylglycerol/lipid kinase family protein [Acidiferrobacterales bacterium]